MSGPGAQANIYQGRVVDYETSFFQGFFMLKAQIWRQLTKISFFLSSEIHRDVINNPPQANSVFSPEIEMLKIVKKLEKIKILEILRNISGIPCNKPPPCCQMLRNKGGVCCKMLKDFPDLLRNKGGFVAKGGGVVARNTTDGTGPLHLLVLKCRLLHGIRSTVWHLEYS